MRSGSTQTDAIGQGLKHETIQKILDKCLLNYKEIKMGPEKWEEAIADVGKIQLTLDYGDDEEEQEENDEDERENDVTDEKEMSKESESPQVEKKKESH